MKFPRIVYVLKKQDNIVYVGSTTLNLLQRIKAGYSSIELELLIKNKEIVAEQIDTMFDMKDINKEDYYINKFRNEGCLLYNKIRVSITADEKKKYKEEWKSKNKEKVKNYYESTKEILLLKMRQQYATIRNKRKEEYIQREILKLKKNIILDINQELK